MEVSDKEKIQRLEQRVQQDFGQWIELAHLAGIEVTEAHGVPELDHSALMDRIRGALSVFDPVVFERRKSASLAAAQLVPEPRWRCRCENSNIPAYRDCEKCGGRRDTHGVAEELLKGISS